MMATLLRQSAQVGANQVSDKKRQSDTSISFSFAADWQFHRTALARQRRQNPARLRQIAVLLGAAVILLLAWMYGSYSVASWTPIPQFALIGGISGGVVTFCLAKLLLPGRIKRLPGYGGKIDVMLDDEGLHATEAHGNVTLNWEAFTRVVQFNDGLLLDRGHTARWLPDSALQGSAPTEALTFVRSKA